MHGAREGWKRDRGKERAREREREREREKGGRPMACGVRGSPWRYLLKLTGTVWYGMVLIYGVRKTKSIMQRNWFSPIQDRVY